MGRSGPETTVVRDLARRLEGVGALALKVHGHLMQEAGWPDLYVAHRTFHGWIEVKSGDRTLTALQRVRIGQIRARGVPALVVRGRDGVLTVEDVDGATVATLPEEASRLLSRLAVLARTALI